MGDTTRVRLSTATERESISNTIDPVTGIRRCYTSRTLIAAIRVAIHSKSPGLSFRTRSYVSSRVSQDRYLCANHLSSRFA